MCRLWAVCSMISIYVCTPPPPPGGRVERRGGKAKSSPQRLRAGGEELMRLEAMDSWEH